MKRFLRSPVLIRRVRGVSMAPTLADGDYVIARRLGGLSRPPSVGDVVLLEPTLAGAERSAVWRSLSVQSMIKRIVEMSPAGYRVAGDSTSSLGSESFGDIVRADIVARIWLRIPEHGSLKTIRHLPLTSAGSDTFNGDSGQPSIQA